MRIETAAQQATTTTPTPPPPDDVTGTDEPAARHGRDVSHGLLRGKGNKTGILKRMSAEEIEAVRSSLSLKAAETADRLLAERAAGVTSEAVNDVGEIVDGDGNVVEGDGVVVDEEASDVVDGVVDVDAGALDELGGLLAGTTVTSPLSDTTDEPTALEEYVEAVTAPTGDDGAS